MAPAVRPLTGTIGARVDGIDLHRYPPTRERRAKLGFVLEFANAWLWTAALSASVFAR